MLCGFGQGQTRAMVAGITAAFTSTYFGGANGDDDTIICRVLTFSSSSCMNLTTATEYVRRLTLVLIMGVVCWIAALVIFGVRSYMRSVYPELRDHSSSASHVLVGIISFLVLVMVFPVLVITLLSALMTL